MIDKTEYLRFRWSHDHALHRGLARLFNAFMAAIPFEWKYAAGLARRRNHPPYNLVKPGSVVAQIGAPLDTLLAGRSRAAYFCLLAGGAGKVVIVEPDLAGVRAFREFARQRRLTNAILTPCAAWSEPGELSIHIDPDHPAANFMDGTKRIPAKRLAAFHTQTVPAETLDSLLQANDIQQLDLASITTNGSEREILKGMLETIARGVTYIALARTGEYAGLMNALGYEPYSYDDRGVTFRQSTRLSLAELRQAL